MHLVNHELVVETAVVSLPAEALELDANEVAQMESAIYVMPLMEFSKRVPSSAFAHGRHPVLCLVRSQLA